MLNISNLSIGYRKGKKNLELLSQISLTAKRSNLIALIGANGVGKSTFLRTLVGMQKSLAGDIYLENQNIQKLNRRELARQVSYVSTEVLHVPNLRVRELVRLGRYPHENRFISLKKSDNSLIIRAMNLVGITNLANSLVAELSDGQRQRAMIARSLAQNTPLFVLDEPTAFLDLPSKFETVALLRQLAQREAKLVIFSTHDLHIAIKEADEIWLMLNNKIYSGTPEDLLIAGRFETLFADSNLQFNPITASFETHSEISKQVELSSFDKKLLQYTTMALRRKKMQVVESGAKTHIRIEKNKAEQIEWKIQIADNQYIANSIYELLQKLT